MHGYIDAATFDSIYGWIKRADSDASIAVDIYVDGHQIVKRHLCDLIRDDLASAGIGNGRYGFVAPLPDLDLLEEVNIIVVDSDEPSARLVQRVKRSLPADAAQRAPSVSSFLSHVDVLTTQQIKGWVINRTDPSHIFDVEVHVDGLLYRTVRNDQPRGDLHNKSLSEGLGGVAVPLPLQWMHEGGHTVSLRFPDGHVVDTKVDVPPRDQRVNLMLAAGPTGQVSIIVPVYNAVDDLAVCIDRLHRYTSLDVDILFIDDASTDPRIAALLRETARLPRMRVLRNMQNAGFSATINRGLEEAGENDVVILNSDARVTPGWLEGMLMAARSGPRIATVTPMSDRAGAFSAPNRGNDNRLPDGVDEITYARAFRRHSLGLYPVVPTGNGFCMFISRACIREVGGFDAAAFPLGYGEENDFCMRAGRAGWRHLIDDRTYVFHDRSKSFGDAKDDLIVAGRAVVDERYPEYKKVIGVFSSSTAIAAARFRAAQALVACRAGLSVPTRILFVVATDTGGTPQTNKDLMRGLGDSIDGWILRCDSKMVELSHMVNGDLQVVSQTILTEPVDPISHGSMEYRAMVSEMLIRLDPDVVHIRHLGWHDLELPRIVKNLGKKVVFSFHDFYTICPTVKLLDDQSRFCGGICTASDGDCQAELWPKGSLPELKHKWTHVWRRRFAEALEPCDAFITTSDSARDLLLKRMPSLPADRFSVIPHGRDFTRFGQLRQTARHGEPIRLLVPGNIGTAKGLDIIYQLIEQDRERLIEFHILGNVNLVGRQPSPQMILHGPYSRDDFIAKASAIGAHLGAVFSIWDETYCHTLTEMWSAGLPVIVFDFPTVATRVHSTGGGWVLDHSNIAHVYDSIVRIAFSSAELNRADAALARWQAEEGTGNTIQMMAASYLTIYRHVLEAGDAETSERTETRIAVVYPDNTSVMDASSRSRLWERTGNTIDRSVTYIPMSGNALLANLRRREIDGAIIQRAAVPRTLVPTLLDAFEATELPFVLDADDAILTAAGDREAGSGAPQLAGLTDLLGKASYVTVPDATFKHTVSHFNDRIRVLPDRLDGRLWHGGMKDTPHSTQMRGMFLDAGGDEDHLALILPALDEVAAFYPHFRLTVVSTAGSSRDAFPVREWLSIVDVPEDVTDYAAFVAWLRSQASRFSFGIAPHRKADDYPMRSASKILQYSALGLPALTSDIGIYREPDDLPPSIRLVPNTTESWITALSDQIQAGDENRVLGRQSLEWVRQNQMVGSTLEEFDAFVLSWAGKINA